MKRCPDCKRSETDDSLTFCRVDGARLVTETSPAIIGEQSIGHEAATRTLQNQTSTSGNQAGTTGPTTILVDQQQYATARKLQKAGSRKRLFLIVAAITLVIATAAYLLTRNKDNSPLNSIAVLPFLNTSGDPNMEYLSDGISESLINSLSQLPNVKVIARSTTFNFKGKGLDPSNIGRQLGVTAVLAGKVVQVGDMLSVQADLINVADGSQIWGERYNRKAIDLLAVEEDIARRIVDKLSIRLTTSDRVRVTKRYTDNVDAYRAYLKGRYEWNKRTPDGLNKSITYFNEAIAFDPTYALAHAGLADTYALQPQYINAPFEDSLLKAKAASLKAIELDDSLAEANVSLAAVKQALWDWSEVEDRYKRGLSLNQNYATGHHWYSEYLLIMGRIDEAESEITLAQQLDPLSLIINMRAGMTYYFARKYNQAEKQLRQALEFNPDFLLTNIFLFFSLNAQGKADDESIPFLVKGFFSNQPPDERLRFESLIRAAYAKSGKEGMLRTARELLARLPASDYNHPQLTATLCAQLNDKECAFFSLNRAADLKHPGIATLKVDPTFDVLRSDPRFQQLLQRMKIP